MKNKQFTIFLLQALAPVALVLIVGLSYSHFVAMAVRGNPVLNSFILLFAAAGAYLMLTRLVLANREHVALKRFLAAVDGGAKMSVALEEPWLRGRLMRRYLDHIAQTDGKLHSQLDQRAIESEYESLKAEFDSQMEMPGFLVGFMIALGLLGTFIGLLETLTGISGMLDGLSNGAVTESIDTEFLRLVGELRKPLAGMGIAFSASMFGLVGSLVLGIMQLSVRRFTRLVLSDAHAALQNLTDRVSAPVQQTRLAAAGVPAAGVSTEFLSEFLTELLTNTNAMQDLFHRSQDASLSVSQRVDMLARKLDDLAQSIESNVDAVKRTNDLLGFGPRMKETNEEMLSEIRSLLVSGQDRQKAMVRMIDSLNAIDQKLLAANDTTRGHYDFVGNVNTQSLSKLDEAVGVLHAVNDRASDSETKLDRRLQALATATTNIAGNLQQLAAKMGELSSVGQSQLTAQNSGQMTLREASTEVQSLLKELQDKMQKIQEVDIGATRHLWEIKEGFGNIASSLEYLKGMSQGVGRQTSLLEATLEEMRNQQRNLIRELRSEMREIGRGAARQALMTGEAAEPGNS